MSTAIRSDLSGVWQQSSLPNGANASLILARYLSVDVKDNVFPDRKKDLHRAMQAALRLSAALYDPAFERYKMVLGASRSGNFSTRGRMVIGLGSENVIETGLTLHHTYGTPMIPGTSLKGLAYHYCHTVWGGVSGGEKYKKGGEYHNSIFGTDDDSGHFIFHDAWMLPESVETSLKDDIVTPHHGDYYNGEGDPTDFDDPGPVAFLSVKGTFHVAISCDVVGDEGSKWTTLVFEMLSAALKEWGIGGKTSSGYGRLIENGTVASDIQNAPHAERQPTHSINDPVGVRFFETKDTKKGPRYYFQVTDDGCIGVIAGTQPLPEPDKITRLVVSQITNERGHQYVFHPPSAPQQPPAEQSPHHKNRR